MSSPGHEGVGDDGYSFDITSFTDEERLDGDLPGILLRRELARLSMYEPLSRSVHAEMGTDLSYETDVWLRTPSDIADNLRIGRYVELQAHDLLEPEQVASATEAKYNLLLRVCRQSFGASYRELMEAKLEHDIYMATMRLAVR